MTREEQIKIILEKKAERKRRRQSIFLSAAVFLVVGLFSRCSCESPPPSPAPEEPSPAEVVVPPQVEPPAAQKPRQVPKPSTLNTKDRHSFVPRTSGRPLWLEELRLQVGARNARIRACIKDIASPAALRWTADIHTKTGRVGESQFEGSGATRDPIEAEILCLRAALADPSYSFSEEAVSQAQKKSSLERVSLIIEF